VARIPVPATGGTLAAGAVPAGRLRPSRVRSCTAAVPGPSRDPGAALVPDRAAPAALCTA
jgi:hypothetical protein